MLIEGQDFIDAQDELSVLDFMRKYGMPERINEEVRDPAPREVAGCDGTRPNLMGWDRSAVRGCSPGGERLSDVTGCNEGCNRL